MGEMATIYLSKIRKLWTISLIITVFFGTELYHYKLAPFALLLAMSLFVLYKYTYELVTVSSKKFDSSIGIIGSVEVIKEINSEKKKVKITLDNKDFSVVISKDMVSELEVAMIRKSPYYRVISTKGFRKAIQIDEIVND